MQALIQGVLELGALLDLDGAIAERILIRLRPRHHVAAACTRLAALAGRIDRRLRQDLLSAGARAAHPEAGRLPHFNRQYLSGVTVHSQPLGPYERAVCALYGLSDSAQTAEGSTVARALRKWSRGWDWASAAASSAAGLGLERLTGRFGVGTVVIGVREVLGTGYHGAATVEVTHALLPFGGETVEITLIAKWYD